MDEPLAWSEFLEHSLSAHAAILGLTLIRYSDQQGVLLECDSCDDHRVLDAVRSLFVPNTTRFWTRRNQDKRYQRRAEHALRQVARLRCLQQVNSKRRDAEEIESVDIEVPSHPYYAKWARGLDDAKKKMLCIFLSGA
eukprot:5082713-Pyramimonas_sp.AAC.1